MSSGIAVMHTLHRSVNLGFSSKKKETFGAVDTPFHKIPKVKRLVHEVGLKYHTVADMKFGGARTLLRDLLHDTPLPKGKDSFSSIHIIAPPKSAGEKVAEGIVTNLEKVNAEGIKKEMHVHRLEYIPNTKKPSPMDEYGAIFKVTSDLIMAKADRASMVVFVGWADPAYDYLAAVIGMLPFRGVSTALITQRKSYGDLLHYTSPSTVFEIEGANAARMGMFPIKAVFGSLDKKEVIQGIREWKPVNLNPFIDHPDHVTHPTTNLPFKIGALTLPMLTHNGAYLDSVSCLSELLKKQYNGRYFPIVSCGETCDALGYGNDILQALDQKDGYYFYHKSGESFKRWETYGTDELFAKVAEAKKMNIPVVIIAVGGGVNGNCIGLISACTNSHLVEVPTTPMHYNDATTSAKKAVSLVKDGKILSKNIMGAFYIPELVFCISETFLTLSTANAHATIGESCKTMNMLGMTNTPVGAKDYSNIEGAIEFASDYTKICLEVGGFDALIKFIEDPETRQFKQAIIDVGKQLRSSQDGSELRRKRQKMLNDFRTRYYSLGERKVNKIKSFISVVNREIVMAKAMFLAYSDPFEKYRALLFEYAHTLGHGVEAFLNLAYGMAKRNNIPIPEEAIRLHGQCVGMAVLWAGQMSYDLGELKGRGFQLHQGFVYLFNRHGGFDFRPCRQLFDALGLTKEEFTEGVLEVVRRDNKRGYCICSDHTKSVDQLVTGRPGKMMRSSDPNAELRYLVEVDEEWQARVLGSTIFL